MRDVVALVFNYSLNGLLADPDTDFWTFVFELLDQHGGPDQDAETLDFLAGASAHVMGRVAYEGFVGAFATSTTNPWTPIVTAADKVVLSRTLRTATWANTRIASGDTFEEIDRLRQGGDGHIVVWGGVTLWRSLMRLDLIDEFRISLYPFVANTGTRLFDEVPAGYSFETTTSVPDDQGVIDLRYRRRR